VLLAALALNACQQPGAVSSPTIGTNATGSDALSASACPASVPAAIAPAADQKLKYKLHGTGSQIYICDATASGGFTWINVNPVANLTTDDGDLVGTHFFGPTWQAKDGSNIVGKKAAGATVDATAIPWLYLTAVSNLGPGRFEDISSVQRLNTVGGLAPAAADCNTSTLGKIVASSYQADYFFYVTRTPGPNGNVQCK
jgi:hypothetical protein